LKFQPQADGKVKVVVQQTTSHPSVDFFQGNLPLRLQGDGRTMDVVLEVSQNRQEFLMEVPFRVSDILIDPETQIISKQNTVTLSAESPAAANLKIYPNPATTGFFIESPEPLESVSLFDLQGRLITDFEIITLGNSIPFYQVQQSSGMYVLRVKTDLGVVNKRLVIR
jgi:hypothetical protein